MRSSFCVVVFCLLSFFSGCASRPQISSQVQDVDAGCGQCLLGLKDKKGCDLAVRMNGQSYFVDGFTMKQFGDAHANDGMCNALRKAKVVGRVENERFVASSFELLPEH